MSKRPGCVDQGKQALSVSRGEERVRGRLSAFLLTLNQHRLLPQGTFLPRPHPPTRTEQVSVTVRNTPPATEPTTSLCKQLRTL